MDSEIIININESEAKDASSPILVQEYLLDNSVEVEPQPVTLDTIFSKLSVDKGCRGCNVAEKGRSEVTDPECETSVKYSECNSSCNQTSDDYTTLLNKYNEVNELYKQNLLVFNDCQYKYADTIGDRDEKIVQLQKMRQIDLEYNTQCKENCDAALVKLNSLISTQQNEIEKQQTTINDLTSKLQKMNNEIEDTQIQFKKEIDSRTNKSYNEIAELHNTNVLITQQLNEKTTESDKLREQNTELITKMNQYVSFNNKQGQNDKPCVIQ